jgi:outer membrane protein assembly factor BamB
MYLHDPQHTGRSPYVGPDSGVVVWAVDLTPEEIHSSPAIGEDGTIYVTTHQPGNSLVAISPEGVIQWRFQAGGNVDSSPLVGADGTIYFGSDGGRLYAVNPDGSLKWAFAVGGGMGFGLSSPNISRDGETVFIQVTSVERSRVYGIRAADGQEVWRYEAPQGYLKGLSPYSPAL